MQLTELRPKGAALPHLLFQHSTRCSLSTLAKYRLERSVIPEGIEFHYLDLIRYRELSNKIAAEFDVYHESPQVLLIRNGACIFDESHNAINIDEITSHAAG